MRRQRSHAKSIRKNHTRQRQSHALLRPKAPARRRRDREFAAVLCSALVRFAQFLVPPLYRLQPRLHPLCLVLLCVVRPGGRGSVSVKSRNLRFFHFVERVLVRTIERELSFSFENGELRLVRHEFINVEGAGLPPAALGFLLQFNLEAVGATPLFVFRHRDALEDTGGAKSNL